MNLQGDEVAYLLGRDGSTKRRLEGSSGCRVEVDKDQVEFTGTKDERELCKLCINMTLQQRRGKMSMDFKEIEARPDCLTHDVPEQCVGFVLGNRGNTLRQFEERTKVYMVFDNEATRAGTKRLYILGKRDGREKALKMVEDAVALRLRKDPGPARSRGGPRRSRSRSGGRRRRSPSPRRSSPKRRNRSRSASPKRAARSQSPRKRSASPR